tara:strand:- start:53 stop:1051 length:999 start_codon:yes stop_codon:yes gene_type:complete
MERTSSKVAGGLRSAMCYLQTLVGLKDEHQQVVTEWDGADARCLKNTEDAYMTSFDDENYHNSNARCGFTFNGRFGCPAESTLQKTVEKDKVIVGDENRETFFKLDDLPLGYKMLYGGGIVTVVFYEGKKRWKLSDLDVYRGNIPEPTGEEAPEIKCEIFGKRRLWASEPEPIGETGKFMGIARTVPAHTYELYKQDPEMPDHIKYGHSHALIYVLTTILLTYYTNDSGVTVSVLGQEMKDGWYALPHPTGLNEEDRRDLCEGLMKFEPDGVKVHHLGASADHTYFWTHWHMIIRQKLKSAAAAAAAAAAATAAEPEGDGGSDLCHTKSTCG